MHTNARTKPKSVTWDVWLCTLGILVAAAAPFILARVLGESTSADEIGYALLLVALVALIIDRRH